MMNYNTLVVLAGTSLLGACAGLVGTFAVLRRRALTGDALAHAALPGLCLAFLVLDQRNLPAMLLGAFVTGILGIATVSTLRFRTRIKEDAAIGIVLSVFYGAGIVLSRLIQNRTTGGSKAGLDTYILGKTAGMIVEDVLLIGGASAVCLMLIVLLYKEFKVVAFDSGFASVQGWPALRLDLLLMAMIALTVVIGLPAVGVVMMAAVLILPAAAARFWTEQLGRMLTLAAAFGLVIGSAGTLASAGYDLAAGPSIVLVGTIIFVASLLSAPRRGVIARIIAELRFRKHLVQRNVLHAFYELCEADLPNRRAVSLDEIVRQKRWSGPHLLPVLRQLERRGILDSEDGDRFRLTTAGVGHAAEITRSERLWELFLSEYGGTMSNLGDLEGTSLEDQLPPEVLTDLENRLRASGRLPTSNE